MRGCETLTPARLRRCAPRSQGHVGADVVWDAAHGGYRIEALVVGDCWRASGGPLAKVGMNVNVGDVITAINRRRLTEDVTLERALGAMAEKEVFVSLLRASNPLAPGDGGRRGGGSKGKHGRSHKSGGFFPRKSQAKQKRRLAEEGRQRTVPKPEAAVLRVMAVTHDDIVQARYRDWVEKTQACVAPLPRVPVSPRYLSPLDISNR